MQNVKEIFNDTAEDYDHIIDLWYSWFFSRLHYIIALHIISKNHPKKVLDIGCGTGLQSYLYAVSGSNVIGIDISEELIKIAEIKKRTFNPIRFKLLDEHFEYVTRYNRFIKKTIRNGERKNGASPPIFQLVNATNLPYKNEVFDHVNCCGSVLSFIPNHQKVVSEISRVLKKSGTFLIEVEGKWNFDALWTILDPLIGNKLQINKDIKTSLKFLSSNSYKDITIKYPFEKERILIELKLFTFYYLKRELMAYRLKVKKKWSINSVTNLIPSTLLDRSNPSKRIISNFRFLAKLEEKLPFYLPGANLVLYGQKI